jgi:hypothetical protein
MSTKPGSSVQGYSCGSIHYNTKISVYEKSSGSHQMSETRPSANDSGTAGVRSRVPNYEGLVSPNVMIENTEGRFSLSRTLCNSDALKVPQYQLSTNGGSEGYQVPQTNISSMPNLNDSFEAQQNDYAPSYGPPKQTGSARMLEAYGRSPRSSNKKSLFSGIKRSTVENKPKPKSRFQTKPVVDQEPSDETSLHEISLACKYETMSFHANSLTNDSGPPQEFHEVGF